MLSHPVCWALAALKELMMQVPNVASTMVRFSATFAGRRNRKHYFPRHHQAVQGPIGYATVILLRKISVPSALRLSHWI